LRGLTLVSIYFADEGNELTLEDRINRVASVVVLELEPGKPKGISTLKTYTPGSKYPLYVLRRVIASGNTPYAICKTL
jgi:hypothetical protein